MFQFHTIFFLILYITLTMSIVEDKFSSKLTSNSNQNHHVNSLYTEKNRLDNNNNNNTNNNSNPIRKKAHQQLLNEHLKVIIIIGSISVGIMIIIVGIHIAIQYFRNKKRKNPEMIEQTIPLNRLKQKMGSTTTK